MPMQRRKRTRSDIEIMQEFCEALAKTGNVTDSCERADADRGVVYRWRAEYPEFKKAWDDAKELGTDALEDEAHRRAFHGVPRKKFFKGKPIKDPETKEQYVEMEYSDTLLIFLLKGSRPEKYRERVDTRLSDADGKSFPRVAFVEFRDADPRPAATGDQPAPGSSAG